MMMEDAEIAEWAAHETQVSERLRELAERAKLLEDALSNADDLYELVRPLWHYAKKGTPDAVMFDTSVKGNFLRKSVERIATLARTALEQKGTHNG